MLRISQHHSSINYLRAILVLIFLHGCSNNTENSEDRFEQLFSGKMTVIDLTHTISNNAPYWPNKNGNPFNYDTLFAHKSGSPAMGSYATPEHFGTHLDAPIHSADGLASVDQLTAQELFAPAAVIDVSLQCLNNADYQLTKADILLWENEYGRLPVGCIVLMYTGWSRKWPDQISYTNQDDDGQMHFPGYSVEAANFLVQERHINGIGIDNLSVDPAMAGGFPVHKIVNGAGKLQLENVANLHLMPLSGAFLIIAPIKLKGGSGGQVRIFAAIP